MSAHQAEGLKCTRTWSWEGVFLGGREKAEPGPEGSGSSTTEGAKKE